MRGGVLEVPAVALRRAVLWEGFGEGDGALGSYCEYIFITVFLGKEVS